MAVHESYIFQVKGRLRPEWSTWFEGLEIHNLPGGDTALTGLVTDQAALQGILRKISDLGLALLCVCRVEDDHRDRIECRLECRNIEVSGRTVRENL